MLLVQEFLLNNCFNDLISKHGVYASPSKCGYKISLNYSQIESNNADKLSQQCRGLILSKLDGPFIVNDGKLDLSQIPGETKIIAYPFNRFFNHGMENVNINWSDKNIKVVEKLDGTLMIVYFDYKQECWHTATRAVPEADVKLEKYSFRELFEVAINENIGLSFEQFTNMLDKNLTYMFELTSYYNQVVVRHSTSSITLIGARDNLSLKEYDIYSLNINVPKVKEHSLSDLDMIVKHVDAVNPLESEGVVAYDSNFNRVKVKSPAYVALHHTISSIGASDRNLLSLILNGHDDDVVSSLPEQLANDLNKMKSAIIKYASDFETNYVMFKDIVANDRDSLNNRKDFALLLNKYNVSWQSPYFAAYSGKCGTLFDFFKKNRNKSDGDWSNAFKDIILEELQKLELK